MNRTVLLLPVLLIYITIQVRVSNAADDSQKLQEIYNSAKSTADSARHALNDLGVHGKGIDQINNILDPQSGTDPHKEGLADLKTLEEQGTQARNSKHAGDACTREDCNTSSVTSIKAMSERAAKLDALGFKKDSEQFPANTKGYMDTAKENIKKYSKFDPITKSYKDCQSVTDLYTHKEKSECDEYYDEKHSNCPAIQAVEIDAKYTYRCTKKREDAIKTCYSEITSMKCKNSQECDNGGIIPGSVASDMKWEYNYPTLTIGKTDGLYWGGHCAIYDRSTTFEIKNIKKLKEFKLVEMEFDDYLWVKVNGHTIFIGPHSGDRLEVKEWTAKYFLLDIKHQGVTTNGHNTHACELYGKGGEKRALDIDLLPYLKEGQNEIWMRVIVSGGGKGWIKIRTLQHCCKEWEVIRKEQCSYEEGVQ